MTLPQARIHALEDVATRLRIDLIRATTAAKSGHPTSAASAADPVAAIFFDAMRFDPDHPRALTSDRFVLSKGHAAPVLYAPWAEIGVIKREGAVPGGRSDKNRSLPRSDHAGERDCREGRAFIPSMLCRD